MVQKKTRRKKLSKTAAQKRKTEIMAITGAAIFLLFSLSIYFQAQTGILGSTIGRFFYAVFGAAAPWFPPLLFCFLMPILTGKFRGKLAQTIFYLLALFGCALLLLGVEQLPGGTLQTALEMGAERGVLHSGGGWLGALLSYALQRLIGRIGIYVLSSLVVLLFVLHLFQVPFGSFLRGIGIGLEHIGQKIYAALTHFGEHGRQRWQERREARRQEQQKAHEEIPVSMPVDEGAATLRKEEPEKQTAEAMAKQPIRINHYAEELSASAEKEPAIEAAGELDSTDVQRPMPQAPVPPTKSVRLEGRQVDFETLGLEVETEANPYTPPPLELLKLPTHNAASDEKALRKNARLIEETLLSFGITSNVVSIDRGPTVTCFELKPQSGVKVSRIVNLADDLSLALAAEEIRIEAPIPGKPYVGIEVPNVKKDDVFLREILQTDAFREGPILPIALGKSISGEPVVASIAKMPHLLIAGATGSGKSVCINSIIMSILYHYTPQEVRMILIDPKVVELSVYGDIPHLLIPVVTDPKKSSKALYLAVQEMERRFKLFSEYAVRDIQGYREKQAVEEDMENLPYLIVIVDELSDLMMVASKDVEAHITRLAQMARACGIHLIIATQRPSVDVITGTIKANIPSRISFQVSSSIDSRTILDMVGAEKLLGKGDMLYYPANFAKPKRVQGAFISDKEVANIVSYIKEMNQVKYDSEFVASIETAGDASGSGLSEENERDALMDEVLEFISHEETTSISGLQRRFRIGYSRAGRIIDDLEAMGAVSPPDGSKPRDVLISPSWLEEKDHESAQ